MIYDLLAAVGLTFMLISSLVSACWLVDRAMSRGSSAKAKIINMKDWGKK